MAQYMTSKTFSSIRSNQKQTKGTSSFISPSSKSRKNPTFFSSPIPNPTAANTTTSTTTINKHTNINTLKKTTTPNVNKQPVKVNMATTSTSQFRQRPPSQSFQKLKQSGPSNILFFKNSIRHKKTSDNINFAIGMNRMKAIDSKSLSTMKNEPLEAEPALDHPNYEEYFFQKLKYPTNSFKGLPGKKVTQNVTALREVQEHQKSVLTQQYSPISLGVANKLVDRMSPTSQYQPFYSQPVVNTDTNNINDRPVSANFQALPGTKSLSIMHGKRRYEMGFGTQSKKHTEMDSLEQMIEADNDPLFEIENEREKKKKVDRPKSAANTSQSYIRMKEFRKIKEQISGKRVSRDSRTSSGQGFFSRSAKVQQQYASKVIQKINQAEELQMSRGAIDQDQDPYTSKTNEDIFAMSNDERERFEEEDNNNGLQQQQHENIQNPDFQNNQLMQAHIQLQKKYLEQQQYQQQLYQQREFNAQQANPQLHYEQNSLEQPQNGQENQNQPENQNQEEQQSTIIHEEVSQYSLPDERKPSRKYLNKLPSESPKKKRPMTSNVYKNNKNNESHNQGDATAGEEIVVYDEGHQIESFSPQNVKCRSQSPQKSPMVQSPMRSQKSSRVNISKFLKNVKDDKSLTNITTQYSQQNIPPLVTSPLQQQQNSLMRRDDAMYANLRIQSEKHVPYKDPAPFLQQKMQDVELSIKGSAAKMKSHIENIPQIKIPQNRKQSPLKHDIAIGTNSQLSSLTFVNTTKKDQPTVTKRIEDEDISKISIRQFDVSGEWGKDDINDEVIRAK